MRFMERKSEIYAAYGSNMNLRQMALRCPSAEVLGIGVLENYKLTFRGKRRGVANIEKCEGATVPVVLWNITRKCEKALDYFEGFPKLYVKKQIKVKINTRIVEAMTYVMQDEYQNYPAKPGPYYLEIIEQGYTDHGIISSGLLDAVQNVQREVMMRKLIKEEL